MDKYKQEFFLKEYNKGLEFETLSFKDSNSLIEKLGLILNLNINNFTTQKLYSELSKILPNKSLIETNYFDKIINAVGINQFNDENIYLIWSIYDEIDKVKVSFANEFWDSVWQPPSDDALIIFLPASKKIILITHYDCVHYN